MQLGTQMHYPHMSLALRLRVEQGRQPFRAAEHLPWRQQVHQAANQVQALHFVLQRAPVYVPCMGRYLKPG